MRDALVPLGPEGRLHALAVLHQVRALFCNKTRRRQNTDENTTLQFSYCTMCSSLHLGNHRARCCRCTKIPGLLTRYVSRTWRTPSTLRQFHKHCIQRCFTLMNKVRCLTHTGAAYHCRRAVWVCSSRVGCGRIFPVWVPGRTWVHTFQGQGTMWRERTCQGLVRVGGQAVGII